MTRRLEGVLVPVTTPFDPATGEVAPVLLRDNARALLEQDVSGIVAAGSTGEASLLSETEFGQVVEWLRDVVPDQRWLIAGAGRESTRATIGACTVAGGRGADAVLVRPPGYYGSSLSAQALIDHFRAVADASPVPVLLYNIPKYTKVTVPDTVFATLADHGNIVGAKDSSGDLKQFAAYRSAAPGWATFMGSGARYYAALELGAVGGILAVACYAAGLAVQIRDRFAAHDRAGAGAVQEVMGPLSREIVEAFGVPGVKAAMDAVGLAGGAPRPPLVGLGRRERDHIAQLLAGAGLSGAANQGGARVASAN
ncbi:MAG: hypothetical protein A2W29_10640 [Gemmatimonadetes bacterium RBG_16_66_8]|nr:MAG: hypothetical protein A2W29_10640 [Gemmatimonadetes bacterium RBG_16_66_8]